MLEKKQLTSDMVKDNAERIMNKIDTQIPLYVKIQSDLYREYIHIIEDFFKAGNTLESASTNTLFQDQLSKNIIEYNIRTCSNVVLVGLDIYGEYLKWYSDVRLAGMKSLNQSIHNYMIMSGMPIKRSTHDISENKASRTEAKKQTHTQRSRRKSA